MASDLNLSLLVLVFLLVLEYCFPLASLLAVAAYAFVIIVENTLVFSFRLCSTLFNYFSTPLKLFQVVLLESGEFAWRWRV
jgi:hypothetical protein